MAEPPREPDETGSRWAAGSPDPPNVYAEPAPITRMPAVPAPGSGDRKMTAVRRGDPDCEWCLYSPRGFCSRHIDVVREIDLRKTLGFGGPHSYEAKMEATFRPFDDGSW